MASPTRTRVRRLSVLVASLASTAAVLASGAQPAIGADPTPAPTKASITWDTQRIRVQVTSPKPVCTLGRRVFVGYVPPGSDDGGGAAVGTTNNRGRYTFVGGTPSYDGILLAYVGKTNRCRPGQSNVLRVEGESIAGGTQRARTYAKVSFNDSGVTVKVTSPKASCARGRKVEIFAFAPDGQSYGQAFSGVTNSQGVFTLGTTEAPRRGGVIYRLTAFTRSTRACQVAQANPINIPSS